MAGLYIHIPFCTQKCPYCNFFSLASTRLIPDYVEAVCDEIALRKDYLQEPVRTIYFGGGTPGLLRAQEIERILAAISRHLRNESEENTLEVNPNNVNHRYLQALQKVGINRLSIGIQSLNNEELRWLHRTHTAEQAITSIQQARESGFNNLSVDMIYGIPIQSQQSWERQLAQILALRPDHLSAYALTVEPGTPLYQRIQKGKLKDVDDTHTRACFFSLQHLTREAGYPQYEVSNFALPGKRSKHNASYWEQVPYWGIGTSAHSYDRVSRQWNVASVPRYIQQIKEGKIPAEREVLSPADRYNEYVMTRLRTKKGCDLVQISHLFGEKAMQATLHEAQKYITKGLLSLQNHHLCTTDKGWFHLDGIAASLFMQNP